MTDRYQIDRQLAARRADHAAARPADASDPRAPRPGKPVVAGPCPARRRPAAGGSSEPAAEVLRSIGATVVADTGAGEAATPAAIVFDASGDRRGRAAAVALRVLSPGDPRAARATAASSCLTAPPEEADVARGGDRPARDRGLHPLARARRSAPRARPRSWCGSRAAARPGSSRRCASCSPPARPTWTAR